MSLPKIGVRAEVENSDGYAKAMKSFEKANDKAAESVSNTAKKFDQLGQSSGRLGNVIDIAFGSFISGVITGGINAVAGAIGGLINKIGQMAGDMVNSGLTFSATMANIQAVTGKTNEEMAVFREDLIRIGADSVAGPQAVADAFYDVVGGVQDSTKWMSILDAAIATSEGGQANLTATTKGLIAVMNSYAQSNLTAEETSNVLTQTVAKGVGKMDEFVEAISPLAGLAASQKIEFKELGAMMAYMTANGIEASRAATYIKQAMTQLSRKTPGVTKALKAMGEKSIEASIANHGLAGTLMLLKQGAEKTKQNLTDLAGGVEALQAITALGTAEFDKFFDSFVLGLDDATAKAREIQRLDVSAQLKIMKSNFDAIGLSISQAVLPAFNKFMTVINQKFAKIDWKRFGDLFEKFGERLAISAGKLLDSIGKALGKIDWEAIFAEIERVVDQVAFFIENIDWDQVVEGAQKIIAAIFEAGKSIVEFVGPIFSAIGKVGDFINSVFGEGGVVPAGATAGSQLFAIAMKVLSDAAGTAKMLIDIAGAAISRVVQIVGDAGTTAGQIFAIGMKVISDAANSAGMLVGIAVAGIQLVLDNLKTTGETIKGAISAAFDAIGKAISDPLGAAQQAVEGLINKIKELLGMGPVDAGPGLIGGPGPVAGAKGGTLQEGLNIVGEKGAEAIVKNGNKAVVVSHARTASLLSGMPYEAMPEASNSLSTARTLLRNMGLMPVAPAPSALAMPAAMPIVAGGYSHSSDSIINYNRNIETVNIHGVPNGESAVQRFARLQAGRRR